MFDVLYDQAFTGRDVAPRDRLISPASRPRLKIPYYSTATPIAQHMSIVSCRVYVYHTITRIKSAGTYGR